MKKRLKKKKPQKLVRRPSKRKKIIEIVREHTNIIKEILAVKSLSIPARDETAKSSERKESSDDSLDGKLSDKQENSERIKEERVTDNSYGKRGTSTSHFYSDSPSGSYADYDKMWGFLGEFRTKGAYQFTESDEKRLIETPLLIPSTPQILCDFEVIETCVKHHKYFTPGDNMNGNYGAVPMGGVNSRDWEKFQLWAMVDYVMYRLFMDRM